MNNVYRVRLAIFAFSALLLIGALPIGAQEPLTIEEALRLGPSAVPLPEGWYRIAPHQVPLSELVRGMFPRIAQHLADDEFRGQKLKESFGFSEGSAEEAALLRAMLSAAEVEPDERTHARRDGELEAIRSAEGSDATRRANRDYMKEDARQLGVVWGQFVADLGGPASRSMVKIREHLEGRRGGEYSMVSTESPDDPESLLAVLERAFQAGVRSVPFATLEGWE